MTAAGVALVQCTAAPQPPSTPSPPSAASPSPTAPPPPPPASPSTTAPPAPANVAPVTAAELGESWRPGCPVEPAQLRRVEINYLGLDGHTRRGELIVHQDLVAEVIEIFGQLRQLRYPIDKMRTVDHYPRADDELSMEDNNTSASTAETSQEPADGHCTPTAELSISTRVLNPYIDDTGAFQPKNAGPYLDRSLTDPGLLRDGDPAVRIFTDHGWRWGGYWRTPKDYQHFERRDQ